jgi:hypothetical protein
MIWNLQQPSPDALFRYDDAGERFYGRVVNGSVWWYPSVTKIIKATSPTPPGLMQWYAKHGFEEANKLRDDAAERGTEMHVLFERYMSGHLVDMTSLSEFHAKALMSFDQWYRDYEVEPLAVEVLLHSDTYGFAGTADLVCRIKGGKVVLVDFKSGSSVYDDYAVQLEMYRLAWNEHAEMHGIPQVTETFNWLPKDWRKEPSCTWKRQTGECTLHAIEYRCKLYNETQKTSPRIKTIYGGTLPGTATIEVVDPAQVILDAHARLNRNDIDIDDDWLLSVGHS